MDKYNFYMDKYNFYMDKYNFYMDKYNFYMDNHGSMGKPCKSRKCLKSSQNFCHLQYGDRWDKETNNSNINLID